MGKAKKIKVSKQPKTALGDQIEEEKAVKSNNRRKVRIRHEDDDKVRFIYLHFFNTKMILINILLLSVLFLKHSSNSD